ncbi:Receptor-type tyrosine-protein phosphatase alpha [Geodia barretti]|uniref:protein-tyrosine-phosphatase n=1 Tax=Geodia barretti TaxID=519541 RepID=A0AA35TQT8_GEOBA|nr:Receptor-type tyrosine-protein phosphatase alpha [Geodia barretti]
MGRGTGVYRDLTVTTPQTVYLNFGGMNLPTNGLVNISQLGNSTDTGLVCSTDQSGDGTPAGGWFNPDGTMLSSSSSEGFFVSDGSDGVYLLRGSGIPVEGIYTCSATDSSGNSRTVFVGIYNQQGGEVVIDGEIGFTLVSELTAEEPQFTLSCNSTNGPATSVIWTRDSDTVGEGTTVLNDAVAAHYTHTLTVTGRLGGVYVCTVSNSISTTASRGQNIEVASAPTNLMLIQTDATTIRVTWTPPSPLGNTIGYTVFYSSTGSNEAPVVREASTNEVELMNLAEGGSYSISLVARSQHLPSSTLTDTLDLVRVPRDLELSVADTTGTSITVSWTVAGGQVESYDIVWGTGLSTEVSGEEESYTIEGLEEGESYTITITASNAAGSTSDDITASTTPEASSLAVAAGAAGGGAAVAVVLVVVVFIIFCVLCCRRRTKQKYDPRNLDGTMFKNHSLPTSYSQGTVEVLSKSTEADDVELVSNRNGVEETAIYDNLIVPKIEEFPEELEVMEGERVAFGVRVTGTPDPKLIWYHNGVEVVPDYSRELAEDGTLSMPSAETKHSGVYQLVAHNPGGRAEREVRLTVREEEEEKKGVSAAPELIPSTGLPVTLFGNFVEQCHSNQNQAFQDQYQGLYNGDDKSTTIAINPDNKPKNRFLNICVYDDHRVTLRPLEGHKDCQTDYINGSYVDGYSQPGKFLATQGPLPVTVVDFWRLVWQERAPTIVMITNLVEGTKIKCHQYWPDKDSARFGPFEVSLIDQQTLADYTVRTLIVQLVGSSRSSLRVTHFHFTAWPDHGVPDYATPILTFHKRVVKEHPTGKGPIMVHCSAGVGRTGTFITIDHVLEQVGKENVVDIPGVINKIRHQRMKLVQTVDQYIFIHDAILESVTCGDTQIASSDLRRAIQQMADKGFAHQFAVLEQVSPRPDEVTAKFAARNPDRNRSQEFLPADKWRVALRGDHPDYINAVFINGYKQQRAFIIAQSPMQSTARDFWKMVYDRKCGVLVMLCDLVESGKETCYQYWPSSGSLTFGEFKVDLLGEELMDNSVLKTLSVTHTETGKSHQVSQFHITNWAPDGSCGKLNSVSSVVEEMTKIQRRTGNHTITVHCSDTVSRSGMFCAIATTIERCKTEGVVDVFQVVKALRVQKPGAVRTVMQYKTIFEAVLVFLDSFDTYANF